MKLQKKKIANLETHQVKEGATIVHHEQHKWPMSHQFHISTNSYGGVSWPPKAFNDDFFLVAFEKKFIIIMSRKNLF